MIAFAYYLLKMFVCSGLLFAYYHLALKNKLFHQWNRFYLIASVIISLAVPCLEFNIWHQADSSTDIRLLHAVYSADAYVAEVTSGRNNLSMDQWITIGYGFVSAFVFITFILALIKIYSIIRSHTVMEIDDIKFVNTEERNAPFSFLNYVFWHKQIDLKSSAGEHIFEHELVHVREKHSVDKLFLQIVLIVFWCNPFFWLIRRELKMIHEFIADKKSVGHSAAHAFAKMILHAAYPQHYSELTNQFFNPSIKRRLAMLTKNNNPRISYISRVLALPLMALLVLAFTVKQKQSSAQKATSISSPVVVDVALNEPTSVRVFKNKKIQLIFDDSVGKKISWDVAQKMGVVVNEKELLNKMQQADKGYVESQIKFASPTVFLDTLIENPLIVVDGKEIGMKNSLNLNEIISVDKVESINVLKGETAIAKYGEKGKDGVIEIRTKNALEGETLRGVIIKKPANAETLMEKLKSQDQKPIVIIDGKETHEDLDRSAADNIESMTVLKGETAKSIYGPKAANGVIIITTKDGKGLTKKEVKVNGEIMVDGVRFRPSEKGQNGDLNEVVVVGYGKNNDQNKVFVKVEEPAEFPGGVTSWRRYLERNLNAQVPSNNKAPQGSYTVVVKFIVGLKGDISELKAITNHGYGMEEEVIRVIARGPKWVPARQNGNDVVSERTQPITFVVAPR